MSTPIMLDGSLIRLAEIEGTSTYETASGSCRIAHVNPSPQTSGSAPMAEPLSIALLLFPHLTQLDLTGPLQVFSSVPGATLHLVWKRIEPVPTDSVLTLLPTTTFAECPQADVICI